HAVVVVIDVRARRVIRLPRQEVSGVHESPQPTIGCGDAESLTERVASHGRGQTGSVDGLDRPPETIVGHLREVPEGVDKSSEYCVGPHMSLCASARCPADGRL